MGRDNAGGQGGTSKKKSWGKEKKKAQETIGCSSDTDIAAEKYRKHNKNNEDGCSNGTDISAEEDKNTYEHQGGFFPIMTNLRWIPYLVAIPKWG